MLTENILVRKIAYTVNDRRILINEDTVNRYSDIVCPITEHLLTLLIEVLGQNCNDTILSAKIETEMETELKEYGCVSSDNPLDILNDLCLDGCKNPMTDEEVTKFVDGVRNERRFTGGQ